MNTLTAQQGAQLVENGVQYIIWAPTRDQVEVQVLDSGGNVSRTVALANDGDGFFSGVDAHGAAGDLYKLKPADIACPSPVSEWQPEGVHGPSQVIDHGAFEWTDRDWQRPPFRDLVIYELHIGTFTPEGTFRAAIDRLPYLRDLGITAIEVMPIADFPGNRGWGYDGVQLFAPARCYGHPDDFRALIDAAHQHGMAVILDVVYNHFGPDGNYITQFSPHYFEHEDKTPWGDAINFGREHSAPVREFYKANIRYWIDQFHIDGFRLDATHAIVDRSERHILAEIAEIVRSSGRYIIAEDERNLASIITPCEEGGYGFNAVWADDFHHTVEVAVMDASRYKEDFKGELHELVDALEHGWIYRGQDCSTLGGTRGTPCNHLPPESFVFCISNHDQVGNRAFGERLNHLVKPATYRAASALLLLAPYTPMLFQGQEWASSSPFLYFTDHNPELGRLVEEGRREECKFAVHAKGAGEIPSPQAERTFVDSKLKWEEIEQGEHGGTLRLYQEALRLRRENPGFRPQDRAHLQFAELKSGVLAMRTGTPGNEWLLLCDLRGSHGGKLDEAICQAPHGQRWQLEFSSNDERFGGTKRDSEFDDASGTFAFRESGLLLLRAR